MQECQGTRPWWVSHRILQEFLWQNDRLIDSILLDKFIDSLSRGSLLWTLVEASITLPLKTGKDNTECDSYRPFSLLNCDVKILAKAIALRLNWLYFRVPHIYKYLPPPKCHSFSCVQRGSRSRQRGTQLKRGNGYFYLLVSRNSDMALISYHGWNSSTLCSGEESIDYLFMQMIYYYMCLTLSVSPLHYLTWVKVNVILLMIWHFK